MSHALPPAYAQAESTLGRAWRALSGNHPTSAGRAYVKAHWSRYVWLLSRLPPMKPGFRVLEVGASILSSTLRREGADVAVAYHELEPEWEGRHKQEGIAGVALELLRDPLPWAAESFDLILCDQVLEHLPLAPDFLIRQMLHLLRRDGLLILSVPNFASWEKRLALLRGDNPQEAMDGAYLYYAHHREPVMREMVELVSRCGGEVSAADWTDFDKPKALWRRWAWALHCLCRGRLGPLLRQAYPAMRGYLVLQARRKPGSDYPEEGRMPPLKKSRELLRV